jgi:hypothetical protein
VGGLGVGGLGVTGIGVSGFGPDGFGRSVRRVAGPTVRRGRAVLADRQPQEALL